MCCWCCSYCLLRPPKEKMTDPTMEWLNDKTHFHLANYMPVFYDFYDAKIDAKDFKSAAKVLEIVSLKKIHFSDYDADFEKLIHSFSKP